jgi:hypothetical protein
MSITAKFCAGCGQKIKVRRASILSFRPYCAGCQRSGTVFHFAGLIILTVCSMAGFLAGRYTAPAKPFNFIGAPVELSSLSLNRPPAKLPHQDSAGRPPATNSDDFITSCEAPTKAGHPCRRKVHGWGYCWQHRDKLGKKPLPKEPELLNKIEQTGVASP